MKKQQQTARFFYSKQACSIEILDWKATGVCQKSCFASSSQRKDRWKILGTHSLEFRCLRANIRNSRRLDGATSLARNRLVLAAVALQQIHRRRITIETVSKTYQKRNTYTHDDNFSITNPSLLPAQKQSTVAANNDDRRSQTATTIRLRQ